MKKIAILLADGTGIRNYLYTDLVTKLLEQNCEIILLHSISATAINEINKVHKFEIKDYKLPAYKETFYQKLLRETICYARLIHNNKLVENETILINWNPSKKGVKKAAFYKIVEGLGRQVAKKYSRILKLEKKLFSATTKSSLEYKNLLIKLQPDVIFSTHQRAVNAVPLISAAMQLNIKTVGAIFSWDNLPKARLSVRTDEYVVWSEYMKAEMQLYYPEINADKVYITGTPQFEFYNKSDLLLDKAIFFERYGLDIERKVICFSGDDIMTSPYDPQYLDDLASEISLMPEAEQVQILFRRCPVDLSDRYEAVVVKYPNIIKEVAPLWNFDVENKRNWTLVYPKFDDVVLLVNTVAHTDAVVNVGSTMAHDYAMFSKPAIYINYDQPESVSWSVNTIYKFQHFKSMGGLQPVFWLNTKKDTQGMISEITLNSDSCKEIRADAKLWLSIIANHSEVASERIVNVLID